MPPHTLVTEQETVAFGRQLASSLRPGAVVALVGGMGAGKTHVTKGLAASTSGVKQGDKIVELEGNAVKSYADFQAVMPALGRPVTVKYVLLNKVLYIHTYH